MLVVVTDLGATQPPIVYVDFDDVLAQTTRRLVALFRERSGREVEFEEMVHFDLGLAFGIDAAELHAFMEAAHEDPVLHSVDPMEEAAETLHGWCAAGAEVAVVTGRPPPTESVSRAWLERHRFPRASLEFVDKYGRHVDRPGQAKPQSLEELTGRRFALAVEDSLATASFLAERLEVPVVLFDRPWNRDVSGLSAEARQRIVRCSSWREIRARIPSVAEALW